MKRLATAGVLVSVLALCTVSTAAAWWQPKGAGAKAGASSKEGQSQAGAAKTTAWWTKMTTTTTYSCSGSHHLKTCSTSYFLSTCTTNQCPTGSFCIAPKTPLPAYAGPNVGADVVDTAQCVKPDAIGPATCADGTTQKLDLVVKGQTVATLDPCPTAQPQCLLGQCVSPGQAVCQDTDGTQYSKLLA
ncbi:MAG: hypothetical protein HYV03_08740, partial [Deltaproteobacteria bacterium]|nr:hypothetical protein [Deltaproteobacteria bacterium]